MGNKSNKKRKLSALAIRKANKRRRLQPNSNENDTNSKKGQDNNESKEYCLLTNVDLEDAHHNTWESRDKSHPIDGNNTTLACSTTLRPQSSISNEDNVAYLVEKKIEEEDVAAITGRRILDINYFMKELSRISAHNALFECKLSNLILLGEKRVGLFSKYKFRCNMCNQQFVVDSEDQNDSSRVEINTAAVTGIISTGIGYAQFEELASTMDIPVFTEKYYAKVQDRVFDEWEKTAVDTMEAAAQREKEAAIEEGRLKNGVPFIDVYVDGCWSARSYGDNYRALSGAAVIIGRKFREVLYIGVKNKYCTVCARAQKKNIETKQHTCYKNFDGSSSSMESDIICEGFKQSLEMYGLIYAKVIADGDSSTYSKILTANPYPRHVVEKIECRNHILRNMCKKLRTIAKDLKYPLAHRKLVTNQKIMTMRKVVVMSIKHNKIQENKNDGIRQLHADITNSPLHAFGEHQQCKHYYCDKVGTSQSSDVSQLRSTSAMWFRLKVIIGSVASKSRSLIEDEDTNTVERFNSVVAKFVGGKRINFSMRRSYKSRCSAAVVSFNTKKPITTLHKKITGQSPKSRAQRLEIQRNSKRRRAILLPRKKNRTHYKKPSKPQNDYGSGSSAPDMPIEELQMAKMKYLEDLRGLVLDRKAVERKTVLQRDSSEWLELRKNLLTASNFGRVIKRKKGPGNLVKDILYKKNISNVASVSHGIENEKIALEQLAKQENVIIEPCGLFIHEIHPFLGASPDGVVGTNTIVEIKCPVAPSKVGMDEAIKTNKIQIYKYNKKSKEVTINKNSNWFFQVQGQLNVAGKEKCIFGIWESENKPLRVIQIKKDVQFWKDKMESKLVDFYMNEILVELVDSRYSRGLPIRDHRENKENKDVNNVQSVSSVPEETSVCINIINCL